MSELNSLLGSGEALVVLGSQNSNPADRRLRRSEIRPVQVILEGETYPATFFDSWGELGVSCLAWSPGSPKTLYIASDDDPSRVAGTVLSKLDLESRKVLTLDAPGLKDVHEMFVFGEKLWISNTGRDEAVAFHLPSESITERICLPPGSGTALSGAEDSEVVDFHCNMVFEGHDGDLYALVHHVSGRQRFEAGRTWSLKRQGDGGVINLTRGNSVRLDLKAPHSVRKIGDDYWILDSGRLTINVYDEAWSLKERLSSRSWPRGADVSPTHGVFYVGTSEIRRRTSEIRLRYKDRIPFVRRSSNSVRCVDLLSRQLIGEIPISGVEEVNSVHLVREDVARNLLSL